MEFQVLGPLALWADGSERPLGGPQQRLVLARLIAEAGGVVSADRLVDDIWGDDPPATARKTIQGYVHHLRVQVGERLHTERAGYALETQSDVDAQRFESAHDAASAHVESDPKHARDLLVDALKIWRGPAYADLRDFHCLSGEIGRLEQRRTAALGDRIDADLCVGRHRLVVGELDVLTAEFPLDERFRHLHMVALYGAGRHVEALRTFERFRRHLRDELGLDPSDDLRRLEHQILTHDVEVVSASKAIAVTPAAVRGYELREMIASNETSETYRAYQRGVGRQVVVRIVGADVADEPAFIAEFARAAQSVAALDHPNIRHVFDTWREPGAAYLVRGWAEGGSLHAAVSEGRLDWSGAFDVLEMIGDALTVAHECGVSHGSVHARNVLFDRAGESFLTDFSVPPGPNASPDGDRRDFAAMARVVYDRTAGKETVADALAILQRERGPEPRYSTVGGLLNALALSSGLTRAPPVPATSTRNPYKGLYAFQEIDAADFFGRDDLVERLLDGIESNRLVAAVGPSGSGKSSLVRAGLLPRVRSSDGPRRQVAAMYPGADPFEELANALRSIGREDENLLSRLIGGRDGLHNALKSVMPSEHDELVLVIDQFEELFSIVDDMSARAMFLDSLTTAIAEPSSRLRIVITLRADFFDRPLQYPDFGRYLERGLVPITSLSDERLIDAIVEPARSAGVEFEPGLAALLVDDVSGQPGGLPLLQHTLTELFDKRSQGVIAFESYMQLGGVGGAVGRRAEEVFQQLPSAGQRAIQPALLRLVTVDDDAHDLRKRVRLTELRSASVDPQELDAAITAFAAQRLLTIDRDPLTRGATVEVAHEALLRDWSRLRHWISEQRDDLVTRRRMHAAMTEWLSADRDVSYLPTGGRLDEFRRWVDTTPLRLTADEREFLAAGEAKAALDEDIERALRTRELRANRRLRRLVRTVVVVALAALAAGGIAFVQRGRADREASAADTARFAEEMRRLVAQAPQLASTNRQVALMLAAEAHARDPGPETLGALQSVLVRMRGFHRYVGNGLNHSEVAWLSDVEVLTAHNEGLTVYNVTTGTAVATVQTTGVDAVAVDRPSRLIAVARGDEVIMFDAELNPVDGGLVAPAQITALAFAPDGRLAVGDRDGTLRLWDRTTGSEAWEIEAHPERSMDDVDDVDGDDFAEGYAHQPATFRIGTQKIAFSDDGRTIATNGLAVVRLWESETGAPVSEFLAWRPADGERVLASPLALDLTSAGNVLTAWAGSVVTLTSEGDLVDEIGLERGIAGPQEDTLSVTSIELDDAAVITATAGGTLRLAALGGNESVIELNAQLVGPPKVATSPDRRRVAYAAHGGVAIMAFDGSSLISRVVPTTAAGEATISERGDRLVMSTVDRRPAEIYDLSSTVARRLEPVASEIPSFAFALHGNVIFGFTESGGVVALDSRLGTTATFDVRAVFVPMNSRDGSLVAFAGSNVDDLMISIFDARTGDLIARLDDLTVLGGGAVVRSIDFSPDGTRLVASDDVGAALLWDTSTWEPLSPALSSGGGAAVQAKYTPDGTRLVTMSERGEITLRDAITLQPIRTLIGNTDATAGLSHGPFFLDDRYMITTADGLGRLWDIEAGVLIGDVFPSDSGRSPNASMNGRWLATVVDDAAVIWEIDIDAWPELACQAAGRGMTEAEWAAFGPTGPPGSDACTKFFETETDEYSEP